MVIYDKDDNDEVNSPLSKPPLPNNSHKKLFNKPRISEVSPDVTRSKMNKNGLKHFLAIWNSNSASKLTGKTLTGVKDMLHGTK